MKKALFFFAFFIQFLVSGNAPAQVSPFLLFDANANPDHYPLLEKAVVDTIKFPHPTLHVQPLNDGISIPAMDLEPGIFFTPEMRFPVRPVLRLKNIEPIYLYDQKSGKIDINKIQELISPFLLPGSNKILKDKELHDAGTLKIQK